MKSTMYNWQYLQEVQLWREFLCGASPRLVIEFDRQSLVVENRLPSPAVLWPGIPDDAKDFATQSHEEDLFSAAEVESLLEDSDRLGADLDEHLFIYDEGDTK